MAQGIVYLVGAGPGDPGLLTLRGREALERADAVVYDHLVSPALLRWCRRRARRIYAGKEAGHHTRTQEAINALLIRHARAGWTVVRLKGGDPFVFGRGGEEAMALARAGIRCEVVPGVTSAFAVPAAAGIPVTHRRIASSVAVVTGHEDLGKTASAIRWDRLAAACDTFVSLMSVRTLPATTRRLQRAGRPATTPCAVIERGTLPDQRTIVGTLETIAAQARQAAIRPPAILIVGEVVRLRRSLASGDAKPLRGRRILVTRAAHRARPLVEQLEALGAVVRELPAIAQAPVPSNGAVRQALRDLPAADWVFFTSPEGITWLRRLLRRRGRSLRLLAGRRIGAIGPKTAAAVEDAGLSVDLVPRRFQQEGLLDALPAKLVAGKRALIFSAARSRDALIAGLRARGMTVRKVPIYRTVIPQALRRGVATLTRQPFDAVLVTSTSCVEHLHLALAGARRAAAFRRLPFASIGPITSAAVRARGGRVLVEASTSTIEGLVDALVRRLGSRRVP